MTAEPSFLDRAALVRLNPEQYVAMVAGKQLRRRDRLVLAAIAKRAHWQSWRWGEGAYRCVEKIAEDTGYCERSVRYAFRALVAEGWLEITPRPGRTNDFTVLRPITALSLVVDDEPEPGENVGDNRPPEDLETPALIAGGAATVAADQYPPPTETTPVAPDSRSGKVDGADAPAQAPPRWRRDGPHGVPGTDPPSSAGCRAEPHRGDAGAARAFAAAEPGSDGVLAGVSGLVALPQPADEVIVTGEHWTRDAARRLRPCPRCKALPGAPCRNRDGKLRKANHRERRIPR